MNARATGPTRRTRDDPVDARPTTDPPAPPPAGRMAKFGAFKRMRSKWRSSYVVYSPQATASQRGRD